MAATASRYLRIAYLTSRPYIRSPVRVHHATEHIGTIPHTLGSALRQDETSRLSYSPGSFPPTTPPRMVVSHAYYGLFGQVSPYKDVNCDCTTAAFTLSPESWVSSCCAD